MLVCEYHDMFLVKVIDVDMEISSQDHGRYVCWIGEAYMKTIFISSKHYYNTLIELNWIPINQRVGWIIYWKIVFLKNVLQWISRTAKIN